MVETMSEPQPSANSNTVVLVLVLLAVAALVYLDWKKGGEIENLHARLDTLVGDGEVLPGSVPIDESVVIENNGPHPLIRSVLQAHTDTEVDSIARDQ
jgi:hypothetical protein